MSAHRWTKITALCVAIAAIASGCDDTLSPPVASNEQTDTPWVGAQYHAPFVSDDTIKAAIESELINDSSWSPE